MTFQIVKQGKQFSAFLRIDGRGQGFFEFDHIEQRLRETLAAKYPGAQIAA